MFDWTSNESPTVEDSSPANSPRFGTILADWFMVAGVFFLMATIYNIFATVFPLE